jgi:hypothetical protein
VHETLGMAQHEVTRTLVKSQPEVWTQCSDADSLGRHLSSSFGEIRITRLEPEHSVAWEGEEVSGTVKIEPSAWGTRVTMAVEMAEEPVIAQAAEEPVAAEPDHEPVQTEPDHEPAAESAHEPALPALAAAGGDAPAESIAPPGLFARMWSRLRRRSAAEAGRAEAAGIAELDQPEALELPGDPVEASRSAVPEPETESESTADAEIEEQAPTEAAGQSVPESEATEMQSETEAALNAALESLGQAHHRPFSRA